jgi:predicted phage terminase large subunit-like protein
MPILQLEIPAPIKNSVKFDRYDAQESFETFSREAWHVIEPGTPLLWNWHLTVLCQHLQAVYTREITRLLIGIAPGHAKSTFISVLFPVWCWVNDPYSRWLCASHSIDLAIRDNGSRRRLIESDWFQERYGHVFSLAKDQNMKSFYQNDKKGYMVAMGVKGSGTGKRASHLLIDDPHNAMEGEADRKAVIEWFGKTWMSRINDQETGPMIVVGQRLHADDLSAHILKLGGWEHLCLPEEFEPARKSFTKIGWEDPRTKEGELLWPEKFPQSVLDTLKRSLGSINYAAQFQQSPVPSGGSQFNKKWFRYYEETDQAYILEDSDGSRSILKERCSQFSTVDLAISSKQTADYTVFAIWAVTPEKDLILLDIIRDHFNNPEQLKQLRLLNQRYKDIYFKIESVAYQVALVQQALAEGIPCRPYNPSGKGDKVARASIASIWMENGKVFFRKNAPYLTDLETELLLFPMAAHDDMVDTLSIAADDIVNPSGSSIWSLDDEGPLDDDMAEGAKTPSLFESVEGGTWQKPITEDEGYIEEGMW